MDASLTEGMYSTEREKEWQVTYTLVVLATMLSSKAAGERRAVDDALIDYVNTRLLTLAQKVPTAAILSEQVTFVLSLLLANHATFCDNVKQLDAAFFDRLNGPPAENARCDSCLATACNARPITQLPGRPDGACAQHHAIAVRVAFLKALAPRLVVIATNIRAAIRTAPPLVETQHAKRHHAAKRSFAALCTAAIMADDDLMALVRFFTCPTSE